jgi:hypothetical protein
MLIPVTVPYKVWVFCRSLAGIAGLNTAGRVDVSLFRILCFQIEVDTWGLSPVQRSPTGSDVSECGREVLTQRKTQPHWVLLCHGIKINIFLNFRDIYLCLKMLVHIRTQTLNDEVFDPKIKFCRGG